MEEQRVSASPGVCDLPAGGGDAAATVTPFQARLRSRFGQLDGAYRASMEDATLHLRRSGMASRAKTVGDRAPDFALPGRDAKQVVLSELLLAGPVVLSFFRGEWCSFCRLELDGLIEARPLVVAAGGQLVMISPQGPTEALRDRSGGLDGVTILQDPLNGVGLQYGLVFRMPDTLRRALLAVGVDLSHVYGNDAWMLPIPATYIIHPDGRIALAHIDPDFTRRLDPDDVVKGLAQLRDEGSRKPG